jgi:hypothetical protein|tara:strand:+ start:6562 stop:6801 length:240 start_codon:yes stop_codon:yes gene_type:complete
LSDEGLAIYPNPFEDVIRIQTTEKLDRIKLFDSQGRWLAVEQRKIKNGYSLEVARLAAGVYVLDVVYSGRTKSFKVIKE